MNGSAATFRRVWAEAVGPAALGLVRLGWMMTNDGDRRVQVYVDGRLYDVTERAGDRSLWLQLDRSRPRWIVLAAVEPAQRWRDLSETWPLTPPGWMSRFAVALRRDESLPVDSTMVLRDGGEEIARRAMWPADRARSGFGGLFGEGQFGWDGAAGPGLGRGEFGVGPFGLDGGAWRWTGDLASGEHAIDAVAIDADGRTCAAMSAAIGATVAEAPRTAGGLALEKTADGLRLRWSGASDSTDPQDH